LYSGALAGLQSAAPAPAAKAMNRAGVGGGGGVLGGIMAGNANDSVNVNAARPAEMSSIAPYGSAREIADLFQYDIRDPITVKKNESAMLPFLQQKINARKLIIYSDPSKANPFTAAELINNTGRTLDGGPITVYDTGAYAGEALVETLKSADKRFISYGVDLGTRISTNQDSRSDNVRDLHFHDGLLITRAAIVQKKTYEVVNVDARPKTLIIEHPVRQGYKLIDTAAPLETARDVYRFEVRVPAAGSVRLPVTEENVYDQQTSVSSMSPDALFVYIRNKNISDAARRQLQAIADLKTKIAAGDTEKRRIDAEVAAITRDEERNRQNIASLSSVSGQQQIVQDYARKLTDQETQIAKLRDRQAQLESEHATLQQQLDAAIEKLQF